MGKEYKGLQENLERFKNDLTDEKMRLLFSIAYKQGYDQALSIADVSNCPDLTLLWEQILLKNEKGELTSYEKHSLCGALNYMERKGMIALKFGI